MTDREAMQQALEALELLARYENPATKVQVRKPRNGGSIVTIYPHKVATEAAAPLRERLAQPEQEPVFDCPRCGHCCPQRKPLTEEEIAAGRRAPWGRGLSLDAFKAGVRFAETTHGIKEKNNG